MEQPATPHHLVDVHGTGRVPDGREVPEPPRPLARRPRLLPGLICAGIVLALMLAGIAGWLS